MEKKVFKSIEEEEQDFEIKFFIIFLENKKNIKEKNDERKN